MVYSGSYPATIVALGGLVRASLWMPNATEDAIHAKQCSEMLQCLDYRTE